MLHCKTQPPVFQSHYVVLNPRPCWMVRSAKDWPWSSYRATAGLIERPPFLTTDWLLDQFAADRQQAQKAYRRFVSEGRGASLWEKLKGQIYLGSESFIESLPKKDQSLREVPKQQRLVGRPSLRDLFATNQSIEVIYQAYRDHGYTQREIAEYLNVHYATISRRIKKWEKARGGRVC